MKKFVFYLALISASLFILFPNFSCKKRGCTTTSAINYDPKAKEDDGSCLMQTRLYPGVTIEPVEYFNRLAKMRKDTPVVIQIIYKNKLRKTMYFTSETEDMDSYVPFSSSYGGEDSNMVIIDTFLLNDNKEIEIEYKEIHGYFDLYVKKEYAPNYAIELPINVKTIVQKVEYFYNNQKKQ